MSDSVPEFAGQDSGRIRTAIRNGSDSVPIQSGQRSGVFGQFLLTSLNGVVERDRGMVPLDGSDAETFRESLGQWRSTSTAPVERLRMTSRLVSWTMAPRLATRFLAWKAMFDCEIVCTSRPAGTSKRWTSGPRSGGSARRRPVRSASASPCERQKTPFAARILRAVPVSVGVRLRSPSALPPEPWRPGRRCSRRCPPEVRRCQRR